MSLRNIFFHFDFSHRILGNFTILPGWKCKMTIDFYTEWMEWDGPNGRFDLHERNLAAGYPHCAHVDFWMWYDERPQRRHNVCVLLWRFPKLVVPFVCNWFEQNHKLVGSQVAVSHKMQFFGIFSKRKYRKFTRSENVYVPFCRRLTKKENEIWRLRPLTHRICHSAMFAEFNLPSHVIVCWIAAGPTCPTSPNRATNSHCWNAAESHVTQVWVRVAHLNQFRIQIVFCVRERDSSECNNFF